MSDDYMTTVSQLERQLTGDHIGSILECRDVFTANQRILDCLIEQINTKEGLLDLCNWLSLINNAPALSGVLNKLKTGMMIFTHVNIHTYLYICVITDVTAVIEKDDSTTLTTSNFDVKSFFHSNKLPSVVAINSAYELSDVSIAAKLSQFEPKGNLYAYGQHL